MKIDAIANETTVGLSSVQFTNLVLEEERYIKGFIRKRLYREADCDDAYQTTLLESYRCREKFRRESSPRVWICGIANNIVLRFNREHIENKYNVSIDGNPNVCSVLESDQLEGCSQSRVENNLDLHYLWENIENAIDKIDGEAKDVFSEVILNGKSYRGVAEKYSIPIGTVKSRIAKVRSHLKTSVQKVGEGAF